MRDFDVCPSDCENRSSDGSFSCHSGCLRYVSYSLALDEEKKKARERKNKADSYNNYRFDSRTKAERRKRSRKGR